jgi:hypothetical protein
MRTGITLAASGTVTVWAGQYGDGVGNAPPPNSWAADAANDVAVWFMVLRAGCRVTLPAARIGAAASRSLYFVEGLLCISFDELLSPFIPTVIGVFLYVFYFNTPFSLFYH